MLLNPKKKSRGWWFILIGIGDILWGISCLESKYTQGWGLFGLLSGFIFTLVGFYFLGKLKAQTFKRILYSLGFIIIAFIVYVILAIIF